MNTNVLLVDESFRCLKAKNRIVLTSKQNNLVLAFSYAIAKHTELNSKFVLSEVYESIYIFANNNMLSCFACYDFHDPAVSLKIIDGVSQVLYNRFKPLVSEEVLNFSLKQAVQEIFSLYLAE
ncbi:MAG: hypothetical protein EAX86_06045 [Candidatus Heimdallarchaeota archaeon]|nr:hypothetical protein [Candidatus Heimdallarchaeota archaeon]